MPVSHMASIRARTQTSVLPTPATATAWWEGGWVGVRWLTCDWFSLLFYLGILPLGPFSLLLSHPNPAQPRGLLILFLFGLVFQNHISLNFS